MGGAQATNLFIGIARTKLAALLLGSAGIGLIGLYQTLISLIDSLTNLGLASSGVRELGAARGAHDTERAAVVALVLRRAAWIIGAVACLLTGLFAIPLSRWTFGSPDRASEVTILGGIVLLSALTTARSAILQGHQRLREIAISGVLSSAASAFLCVLLYWRYGERGILPSLLVSAGIGLGFAVYYSRFATVSKPSLSWVSFWKELRHLATLGFSFMFAGILMTVVAVVTRVLILRELGMEANGLYQAAYALSGMFAGFILNAMAIDFFPRLSAVSADNEAVNRLVNDQTEVGVLLALPGLVCTIAFGPLILRLFYTAEFLPAAPLLGGLFFGCFAQVVGWPLGFVARAKGKARWVLGTECGLILLHLALVLLLLPLLGLQGVAIAFTLFYLAYILVMWAVARHLSGFQWSRGAYRIIGFAFALSLLSVAAQTYFAIVPARLLGAAGTVAALLFSVRGISLRLGPEHRIVRLLSRFPGWSLLRCHHR